MHITQVRNRQVHLLLISLANISADAHRKGSTNLYLLLALLPVLKFLHPNKCLHGILADCLLHQVISIAIKPLKKATEMGCMMSDPLGNFKYCFTPIIAYITDTPEQCTIACVTSNASSVTMAVTAQFGDPIHCAPHTASMTRQQLIIVKRTTCSSNLSSYFQACQKFQLNGVSLPYWLNWALADLSSFITIEALHQYFRMLWDHNWKWCSRVLRSDKLDFQFSLLQTCHGYCHFPDGIMTLKQTLMQLHWEVQRYIIGVVAGGIPQEALIAVWVLADFHYQSQAPRITDADIVKLSTSLQEFHDHKAAFMEAGAWGSLDHWNIPRLEMMLSVVPGIPAMGTIGQWSADITEHAHIDIVKNPAQSSNNQNFDSQICCYLDHQEKCQLFMHATTICASDLAEYSDDSGEEHDRLGSRKITDLFQCAAALTAGNFPAAPHPYQTFASAAVAFHLSSKPAMMNMTIDSEAELYKLPNFKPAIADYLDHHLPDFTHMIGG